MNDFRLKYIISEEIHKVADIVKAEKGINRKPSEAQKSAGNYKMGHIKLNGFDITIENPKGSYRYWKDENGKEGKTLINNHYGYFTKTLGKDGDQIDVFIGSKLKSDKVYVVDQNNDKGEFDESKVMLCFDNIKDAKKAYMSNYNKGWKGFRNITGVDIEVFKKWLYDGKKQSKPFSDYVSINTKKIEENVDKFKQLNIINRFNPMKDNYHVGIRNISDIKSLKEAMDEAMNDYKEYGSYSSYPDISNEILENALSTGKIKIYSSYPIMPGVFVTPSKMQANDYAGGEKIYSKMANIDDIAWINVDEGQYTGTDIYEAKNEKKSGLEIFLDKHGIKEIKCGVGFSDKEQKWYGWSHRAIYGFGIGSKVKKGDCAYNGKEWTAKTLKDAKKMAEDFAKSVA